MRLVTSKRRDSYTPSQLVINSLASRGAIFFNNLSFTKPVIRLTTTHGWRVSCVNTKFDIKNRTTKSTLRKIILIRLDNGEDWVTGKVVHFFANYRSRSSSGVSTLSSQSTKSDLGRVVYLGELIIQLPKGLNKYKFLSISS